MAIQIMNTSIFRPIPENEDIALSPSVINSAQVCMRLVAYHRARLKPLATPQNLVFGTALHWVLEGYLKGYITPEEMAKRFTQKYREVTLGKLIAMAKTKTTEVSEAVGERLADGFHSYFVNLGLRPVVIEGRFKLKIGPHEYINLVIDFVGVAERPIFDPDGKQIADIGDTVILDWKTCSMVAGDLFVEHGYQLTYYWLAVKLACEKLKLRPPKLCGYAEGFKPNCTKTDSISMAKAIWKPVLWARRSDSQIEEAIDFALVVAKRLRRGEFFRAPHMGYNSPCDSGTGRCDFAGICLEACLDGYQNKQGFALAELI
jgi:hypothetical protein